MRLEIVQAGDPVLRRRAGEVTPERLAQGHIQWLIDLMVATMRGVGVGLAAPQIGEPLRIVVIEDTAEYQSTAPVELLALQERAPVALRVFVNPELEIIDPAPREFFEGCLSVNGWQAIVPRARKVQVRALDRDGAPVDEEATGWFARILQHEVDHLDGHLCIDRMLTRSLVSNTSYRDRWRAVSVDEAKRRLGVGS
jgi:peptide deformylase